MERLTIEANSANRSGRTRCFLAGSAPQPFRRHGNGALEAKKRVGPPDAVNTGGPVPLIKMLAGKGGFAGQVRRQRDPSVRPVHCNAKWSLT
jgi:hypothetical protein